MIQPNMQTSNKKTFRHRQKEYLRAGYSEKNGKKLGRYSPLQHSTERLNDIIAVSGCKVRVVSFLSTDRSALAVSRVNCHVIRKLL